MMLLLAPADEAMLNDEAIARILTMDMVQSYMLSSSLFPLPLASAPPLPVGPSLQQLPLSVARPPPVYEPEPSLTVGELLECVVCRIAPKASFLLPCGHVCMCVACAQLVSTCPLCRQSITDRMRVFL